MSLIALSGSGKDSTATYTIIPQGCHSLHRLSPFHVYSIWLLLGHVLHNSSPKKSLFSAGIFQPHCLCDNASGGQWALSKHRCVISAISQDLHEHSLLHRKAIEVPSAHVCFKNHPEWVVDASEKKKGKRGQNTAATTVANRGEANRKQTKKKAPHHTQLCQQIRVTGRQSIILAERMTSASQAPCAWCVKTVLLN